MATRLVTGFEDFGRLARNLGYRFSVIVGNQAEGVFVFWVGSELEESLDSGGAEAECGVG